MVVPSQEIGSIFIGISNLSTGLLPIFITYRLVNIADRVELIRGYDKDKWQRILLLPIILITSMRSLLKGLSGLITAVTVPKILIIIISTYIISLVILKICNYIDKYGVGNGLGIYMVFSFSKTVIEFLRCTLISTIFGTMTYVTLVLTLLSIVIIYLLNYLFWKSKFTMDIFDFRLMKKIDKGLVLRVSDLAVDTLVINGLVMGALSMFLSEGFLTYIVTLILCTVTVRLLMGFYYPVENLTTNLLNKSQLLVGVKPENTENRLRRIYWFNSILCVFITYFIYLLSVLASGIFPLAHMLLLGINGIIIFDSIKTIKLDIITDRYLV